MTNIPMLDLKAEYHHLKPEIDEALQNCFHHQRWILGPEVGELEKRTADYLSVRHCIGVSSGTEALALSLRALAIRSRGREYFTAEDEILTSPFTFTATGDAILRSGATPVFIDINPQSFNLDIGLARDYLQSPAAGNVVGILPVHLYGRPCDMQALCSLAEEHGLFVVEDCAQSIGGSWQGRKVGSWGTAGAFSFFPSKNLGGCGDGGMVSTDDEELAVLVRHLTRHGGRDKYNVEHIGYNARLDTIQAAVLLVKLGYLDDFNTRRLAVARAYSEGLNTVSGLTLPEIPEPAAAGHVFHQYTVIAPDRDNLQRALRERGVSSMVYYPVPLHQMKLFGEGRCRIAAGVEETEKASRTVLSLPIGPFQRSGTTAAVIEEVRRAMDGD